MCPSIENVSINDDDLFLISDDLNELPTNYALRSLQFGDYDKGYLQCLSQLTIVGDIDREAFQERFEYMRARCDTYIPCVISHPTGRIIAAGTLIIERKFIRNCGLVGHIEDIVVDSSERGKNLGKILLQRLKDLAVKMGCYKVILDCEESKVQFYEKCGFTEKGRQMAFYNTK